MAMKGAGGKVVEDMYALKDIMREFIRDYIKETEGQRLEEFDKKDLTSQKQALQRFGYFSNSGTLSGFTKSLARIGRARTNNNSRSEEKFIIARRRYLEYEKEDTLSSFSPIFENIFIFEVDRGSARDPEGVKQYLLDFLNKLPASDAKTKAMTSISGGGEYVPNEDADFPQELINVFSKSLQAPVGPVNQSGGRNRKNRRETRQKKAQRKNIKKTRRN